MKFTATMVADTGVLAFWVFLVWVSDKCILTFAHDLSSLDATILKALQFILGLPVIIQSAAFTLVDLSAALRSSIKAIKNQWKK